jgi:hypothetical protein
MKPRDPSKPVTKPDALEEKIRQALREEGVIIPKTVEEVRLAKARLKKYPVTVPPRLRDPSSILDQIEHAAVSVVANNVVPMSATMCNRSGASNPSPKVREEFVEAVVIAQLTRLISTSKFPLGRKRYNKLGYLSHRKAEHDVSEQFLKKAAGPYSPWAKYQGPENIALKNGYVKRAKVGVYEGFVVGDKIDRIDQYLSRYSVCSAVEWVVNKLGRRTNDDLELLATVDFAALDLIERGTEVTGENVKHVIATNTEWAPKLKREIFSELNIARALAELRDLFPSTYV